MKQIVIFELVDRLQVVELDVRFALPMAKTMTRESGSIVELESEPETNTRDATILQRRIGKAGARYAASPRACSAKSCSGEECVSLDRR